MGVVQSFTRRWAMAMAVVLAVAAGLIGFGAVDPATPTGTAVPMAPIPGVIAAAGTPLRIAYGSEPDTVGDLYLPSPGLVSGSSERYPVVVLIHGGGWSQYRNLGQFAPQARQLAAAGVAVWNIEYRRLGGAGGWPVTLTDVADAVRALPTVVQQRAGGRLDLGRIHIAGHSAGGQLAAWVGGRAAAGHGLPHIRGLVLMSAVLDLRYAVNHGQDGFARRLLGGRPDEVPDRYQFASPIANLPAGTHITALHGGADPVVPVGQSSAYVEAARAAGNAAELHVLPGVGHAEFTDAGSPAWAAALAAILAQVTLG